MAQAMTVGRYLLERLRQRGVRHIFGVPGDYVLGFYDLMEASPIEFVGTSSEAGAGFAADAYARVNGLGALCVTYCVGGLNTVNAVAGAYAEKSPLVVISGSPGMDERVRSSLLHHRVRDFGTQRRIFDEVTVASAALEDPARAPEQIDSVLAACARYKRPVYIELPRDMCNRPCARPRALARELYQRDARALGEAVAEASAMLRAARRPVILAGVEIHRFGLQDALLKLVERTGFPVAATLLGKSVISERHPRYLGVYEGAMGREEVRRAVEGADCVLILGAFMTDINLGIYTASLDVARTINATSERLAIKRHQFEHVPLGEFILALSKTQLGGKKAHAAPAKAVAERKQFRPRPGWAVTIRRFFQRMNDFLADDDVVICDIGDSLFGAADLTIHRRTEFLSPAYYTSMGFAIPASVGAQVGRKRTRGVVFVGDGAFQMTGMELSTVVRQHLNPIVFVLNNKGYTTERMINEGAYNDILNWSYHRMPELLGSGWGCEVRTEGELECALQAARANTGSFSIINLHLDKLDCSDALARLGKRLGKRLGGNR